MKRLAKSLLAGVGLSLVLMGSAVADESSPVAASSSAVPESFKTLTINGQTLTPDSVRSVPLEGPIYEVRLKNGDTVYSDADGRYMVLGSLFDNAPQGLINLTEQSDREARLAQLSKLDANETVVFPAQGASIGTITVFTDTTCHYCQMLHQEIDQLTAAGVEVRYVPFPREGSQSPGARQLAQVMCSTSPQDAITAAFQGRALEDTPTESCSAAVSRGFALGQQFGVKGTPSIVLPNGEMGEGYMPADKLVQGIKSAGS
ncbi:DsbC family protein [uncultured Salinicola sp.]|uniref:DsbC family protein n=1 Tax=uncultured Salinicola sp. TaxID=1193542 RepID=UPI002619B308|nr:DsbC family protein [uncultured Salinicola sp.]